MFRRSIFKGVCPDCYEDIPDDVSDGDACNNCGHVFYKKLINMNTGTEDNTEEVCNECGSSRIGYEAWVKNINGELEIIGGPYDHWQCLNDPCKANDPRVRRVPVENLKYCDGVKCDYHGDKDEMTAKKSNEEEPYWYCATCTERSN